jgi:L-amino acid N-acyltransferase YncA
MKLNLNIRPVEPDDLPAIVDIYNEAVLAKYCTADTRVQRVEDKYVTRARQRQGVATSLVSHALAGCPDLRLKTVIAIVLEGNAPSLRLLGKFEFEPWRFLPRAADFDGAEVGHVYLGKRVDFNRMPT